MIMNFENLLVIATLITGFIVVLDKYFWSKKRGSVEGQEASFWIAQSKSFFPILLIVLLIRSFLVEPFRIPTGSLEPTLQIGDFILVNKFIYGLRLPMLHKTILPIEKPKRGDVVVFRHPTQFVDYIKRVVGLPGDRVRYVDKVFYVNGVPASQIFEGYAIDKDSEGNEVSVIEKEENLLGVGHKIFLRQGDQMLDPSLLVASNEWVVPKDMYFMVGDNRDDSYDSRYWGFVPEENLKGKAVRIWLSWDNSKHRIRWERMGKRIE
jgi:signal peptidase I